MSPTLAINEFQMECSEEGTFPPPTLLFPGTSLLSAMVSFAFGFVIEQGTFSQQNVRLSDKDWAGTDRDFADRI